MSAWQSPLMTLYCHGTYPLRAWQNRIAAKARRSAVLVVFYHRVADDRATPWTTTTAMFARQIEWLARNFEVVSLDEAQARIRRGNARTCVSVTFDDGYAVNGEFALPLLVDRRLPSTYFLTTEPALTGVHFVHDRADDDRTAPHTTDELRHWIAEGIEIGAHTRTHPDLGQVTDEAVLYDEVVAARDDLAQALGQQPRYFAFPFGQRANLNRAAFHIARQAGYLGVCSAYGGYNFPGDDPFHLRRYSSEQRLVNLKNWATIDPRKRHIGKYEYGGSARNELAGSVA